jgi:hypothetical protein
MAGRQKGTFQKRQKEAKRLEKQRLKAEKRTARRLEKTRDLELPASETEPPVLEPEQD